MKKAIAALALSVFAQAAMAFPTWMGVYGAFVRHDDTANPGVFTILMNQDYYGLQAAVGVQVNGGSWTEYPMTYAGNVSGNSKWTLTPSTPFPAGATVKYYFHGYGGGNIWDSNGGSNYSFTVPAAPGLSWDGGVRVPLMFDLAAEATRLYGVAYDGSSLHFMTRLLTESNWAARALTAGNTFSDLQIAARDGRVVIHYQDAGAARQFRSTDDGATFNGPEVLPLTGEVLALEASTDEADFHAIYVDPTSNWKLYHMESSNGGASWSAATLIATISNSTFASLTARLAANSAGIHVGFTYDSTDPRGFGSGQFYGAFSADGATWDVDLLVTYDITRFNTTYPVAAASASAGFIGLGKSEGAYPNSGPAKVWRRSGGNWVATSLPDSGNSNFNQFEALAGGELVYIDGGAYGQQVRSWLSRDSGLTFEGPAAVPAVTVVSNFNVSPIIRSVVTDVGLHLLWAGADITPSNYVPVQALQTGVLPMQTVDWVGNTYHWPVSGQIDAGESVWVNTESAPKGAGVAGAIVFKVGTGGWSSTDLFKNGTVGDRDAWHANLGTFSPNTTVEYAVAVIDGSGDYTWDTRGGQNYRFTVNPAATLYWVGAVYHWPPSGSITSNSTLWINAESWPKGAGSSGVVVYQVNGGAWQAKALNKAGTSGNNDWWNCSMGKFPSGATVRYAVMVKDANGKAIWNNNGGQDYRATVN